MWTHLYCTGASYRSLILGSSPLFTAVASVGTTFFAHADCTMSPFIFCLEPYRSEIAHASLSPWRTTQTKADAAILYFKIFNCRKGGLAAAGFQYGMQIDSSTNAFAT